jgi:hypothetical protein
MGKGNWLMRFLAKCEGNYIQPTLSDYQKKCHHCKEHRDNPVDRTFWIDGLW